MEARRLLHLLLVVLPVAMAGTHLVQAPAAPAWTPASFTPAVFLSAPRQSLPQPVHDEATCAFCQAAVFAPHAAGATGTLSVDRDSVRSELPSFEERFTHSGSRRPPRSRAPPLLRAV